MKNTISKILSLFLFIFLIASVSSLNITETSIEVNKTYQINQDITLTITNYESMDFYNITFKEDNIINLPKFDLKSGENITTTATIISDSDYSGTLTLIGDYETNLGQSNKTETITIDYNDGFDLCHLDLIKGDSINWINDVSDDIKLINADTNQEIATILENKNYTKKFNYPDEFDYYATRIGLQFTETCRINVMNDEGFVHNSKYDDTINAEININYLPTTISTNFIKTSYTIEHDREKQDIFTIENTGSEIARNIKLSAEWFSFDKNNFDLNSGDSINVGYTISPEIFETNLTNQTYDIDLKIKGNFNTINQEFNIFIPFDEISSFFTDGVPNMEFIENVVLWFCKENPETCGRFAINGSYLEPIVSSVFTDSTIRELLESYAKSKDFQKAQLEVNINQTDELKDVKQELNKTRGALETNNEKTEDLEVAIYLLVAIILFVVIFMLADKFFIRRDSLNEIRRKFGFYKNEK